MEAYQLRVIEEHDQLKEKIDKLDSFFRTELFNDLPPEDQKLLGDQFYHMNYYLAILKTRILKFISKAK